MFIRKSKISAVIKREKLKERNSCEKLYKQKLKTLEKELTEKHQRILNRTIQEFNQKLQEKDKEIRRLQKEIDKNHSIYLKIRQREKQIDLLSSEIDDVVNNMVIKVQESIQPFYRTRAKVLNTKKKSDKNHNKVESIFREAK